ncbi:hypothetical protein [Sphingobium chungbukense]|nr:hypothetical protein [Sphingobium chungbukense]
MRDVLTQCRDQFAFYADEHRKAGKVEKAETNERFRALADRALSQPGGGGDMGDFQSAVGAWMVEVFGEQIAMDPLERIMRFLEEALELAQAEGMTATEVGRVVDYVYGRPVGETFQEVGGVLVTLAAFCFRREVDLKAAALTEFDRIDSPEMRKRIFDKQAFKRAQGLTSDGGFRAEGGAA